MKTKLTGILGIAVAASIMVSDVNAKNIKVQASSKSGDWAHLFMTENYAPRLKYNWQFSRDLFLLNSDLRYLL